MLLVLTYPWQACLPRCPARASGVVFFGVCDMRGTCVLWLLCTCVTFVVAVQHVLLFSCLVSPLFLRLLAVRCGGV